MTGTDVAHFKMRQCKVLAVINEHVAVRAAFCEKPLTLNFFPSQTTRQGQMFGSHHHSKMNISERKKATRYTS